MKYEFHVGDYVETKDGRVGYIKNIFHATELEPPCINWVTNDGESFFYPIYSWTHCYDVKNAFNRIGQYDFAKSEPPKEIERLNNCNWNSTTSKINELVDAVNELRKELT